MITSGPQENKENFVCLFAFTVPWHVPAGSDGRLKHQIEGDGWREVISCGGRLDVVFHKEVRQFLLGVVVHLKFMKTDV